MMRIRPTLLALGLLLLPGTASAQDSATERFHLVDPQLARLVETALEENPRLASAWSGYRASRERVPQQTSLPDPQLTYRYFAMPPETRVGPQEHGLELSQALPWAGKRRLQGEWAEGLASSRAWEAQDLERGLVADIKRSYYEAAYLQEALQVNEEELEILRRFEGTALKRYATGQGIQQSVVKVQTEISRLTSRHTELRRNLDSVCRTLAALIGRTRDPLTLASIELPLPDLPIGAEALEAAAVTGHPRIRGLEERVSAEQARTDRRRLEGRPDFRLGIGYTMVDEREDLAGRINPPEGNGDDIIALSVGISIPLYRDRIRAGVTEASESRQAHEQMLAAARDRLRREIQQAALALESLGERVRLYQEVIVPQAEESLGSAEAAYTTDRLGFLDLLDAERVLFQSRLASHRLMADLWIALADLEQAAGVPVPPPAPGGTGAVSRTGQTP